jgi:hypothetical protein
MDLQLRRQRAHRREWLFRLKLAADKGFDRGKHNPVEDGLAGLELEAQ